jgi:hypothetical protein
MPDGKTHKLVGAGTGAVYASSRAKEQTVTNWCAEVAGGAFGGYVGGALPDVLEPALSPWHRNTAHSGNVLGGIIGIRKALEAVEFVCRENAEKAEAILMEQQGEVWVPVVTDPISQLIAKLVELFWRVAAGFVNGVAAGYASHLALDAMTPRSIPLLTSGF